MKVIQRFLTVLFERFEPRSFRRAAAWSLLAPAAVLVAMLAACGGEEAADAGMPSGEHSAAETHGDSPSMSPDEVMIDPRRQQLVGITYGVVERRDLEQEVRTVGVVEYDETRLVDVNLKFDGWVEDLYADETGLLVREGQELLRLYSPALVATQEEYLSAYSHNQRLQGSGHPEALEGARRLLEAARQRLSYWDIEEVHLRDLERDGAIVRSLPIHSPASGYVIEKHVVAGSFARAGHLLYKLANLDRVWVLADVYEYELPLVSTGQRAEVTLSYLPGETFRGTVTYVYPYLETAERTVKVRIELPNPGHRLKNGMYADVRLAAQREGVLVVPEPAVLDSGERRVVFLSREDGRFEPREVQLGSRFGELVEILAGLEEGQRIVTSGNFLLDSESQLQAGMGQMSH